MIILVLYDWYYQSQAANKYYKSLILFKLDYKVSNYNLCDYVLFMWHQLLSIMHLVNTFASDGLLL